MRINRRSKTQSQRSGKRRFAGRQRFARSLEPLERRELLAADGVAAPWHNAANPRDVNHDNRVSPIDAMLVINELILNGVHTVPTAGVTPQAATGKVNSNGKLSYLDVNGDNIISPIDAARVINLLAVDKLVRITTIPTDLAGNPITQIPAGSDFLLQSIVEDIRVPEVTGGGLFSAYLNVSYDSGLATIPQPATFSFDPFFSILHTYDASLPGQIVGAGASATTFPGPGNDPQDLWTVLVHAEAGGVVNFTPSFDTIPGHDVVLYGEFDAITEPQIDFVGAALTITENPTISVAPVSANEGNAAATAFVFTVTLSNSFNQTITVQYNTATPGGGSVATAGVDYTATSGTVTFTPGQTQQIVTVLVNGDLTVEPNENFNFVLSNPTNATLGTSSVTGTIVNDDVLSSLVIGDVTVMNVTSGTTNAVFTVSLSPAATSDVTVQFTTANGTALAGTDYTGTSGTLTFNPGITTRTITVSIIGDPLPDETEAFLVNLTNPSANALLADGQATGTIQPAVPIPNLAFSAVSATEGNSSTKDFVFTATLSSPASQQILVAFATADGTPPNAATVANNDYLATSGTITFAPGQSVALITVVVVGDATEEPSETFRVNLTPISGTLGTVQNQAIGTIQNDDGPASISINDVTVIGGADGTDAVFTVTLSSAVTAQSTVSYATSDGSAAANEDYLTQTGILTFAPGGPLTRTITVPVLGSALPGPDETFFVNLSSPTGALVVDDSQGVGTIVRQGLTIGGASVVEGNSGPTNALFTVNLSESQDTQVTVAFATSNGTATTAGGDYAATSGTLTFAPNETQKIVTVAVSGDTTQEANETFFVNLSNASGATIFSAQGTGTILNDDGQKVAFIARLADSSGNLLGEDVTLDVGDEFQLKVFVQDVQSDPNGIVTAFLDAVYDSNLVMVNGPIVFSPFYSNVPSGSTATPGLIDEVGALGDLSPPANPGAEQLLFTIDLKTLDVGLAQFTLNPADLPGHDVLEYTSSDPIPPAAINFVGTSINIGTNVFTVSSVQQTEGTGGTTDFVFTITRFLPSGTEASIVYSTSNGTANAGADYVTQTGTLTFAPGDTAKLITITVNGDTTDETDETFFVNLSDPVGAVASASPGVGTILDDDGPVSISVANASGSEDNSVPFTVSLSAVSGKTVTVVFTTADPLSPPTATAGVDYQPTSGTLTFAPGVTQQVVNVAALPDLVIDENENFRLLLSAPTNATLSGASAVGTIIDVPPATIAGFVYADLNDNGVKEGNEVGIENVTVHALRNGVVVQTAITNSSGEYRLVGLQPGTYSVHEVQPGFFIDGRDTRFGVLSATNDHFDGITLAPSGLAGGYNFGEIGLRAEFVPIFFNRRAFFALAVLQGHYGPATSTSNLDLRNGDAWISIDGGWQGPRTVEALFNATQGWATMTLYNNSLQQIAVSSATADGAKMSYSGTSGETYFLKVSGTNSNVTLHVTDTISVNNVSLFEGTGGTTNMVFTVSLSTPRSQEVTVSFATADGTATAGEGDYVAQSGTLSFAPGETTKLVTVAVNGDSLNEADETLSLVLSSPTNIVLGVPAGLGTIRNDDGLNFNGFIPFANGANATIPPAPAAAPAAAPVAATAAAAPTASPSVVMLADSPAGGSVATAPSSAIATDVALEEDEDWVTELQLA
ncbi:MAG: Calx-beta domain-containing protein [Pirellulales bacterium]